MIAIVMGVKWYLLVVWLEFLVEIILRTHIIGNFTSFLFCTETRNHTEKNTKDVCNSLCTVSFSLSYFWSKVLNCLPIFSPCVLISFPDMFQILSNILKILFVHDVQRCFNLWWQLLLLLVSCWTSLWGWVDSFDFVVKLCGTL